MIESLTDEMQERYDTLAQFFGSEHSVPLRKCSRCPEIKCVDQFRVSAPTLCDACEQRRDDIRQEEQGDARRLSGRNSYARHSAERIVKSSLKNKQRKVQTPPWVDMDKYHELYAISQYLKSLGHDTAVDHIFAITPRDGMYPCSGLNTPENMQIVTRKYNSTKGNRHNAELYPEQAKHLQPLEDMTCAEEDFFRRFT